MKKFLILFILTFSFFDANAIDALRIESELHRFYSNPHGYQYQTPRRTSRNVIKTISASKKLDWRSRFFKPSQKDFYSEPRSNDLVGNLLRGYKIEKNIKVIDQMNLQEAKLSLQPCLMTIGPYIKES